MQTTINDKGVLTKEIKITFSKDEVNKKYNEKLKAIAPSVSLPGFRKGKVSPRAIEMKFKANILDEVRQDLAKAGIDQISKEVNSYGDYNFLSMDDVKLNAEFTYQFSTSVFPEVQLPEYKGLKYQGEKPEVKDEEVDNAIQTYISRLGELKDMEDDTVCEEKDIVNLSYNVICDSNEIANNPGSLCPANLLTIRGVNLNPNESTIFIGKKKGDQVSFEGIVSDTFESESLRGKKASVSAQLIGIKRNLVNEFNDDIAKKFGLESAEQMKNLIKQQLLMQKTQSLDDTKKETLLNELASKINFDIPDQLYNNTLKQKKLNEQGGHDHGHVHGENCDHDHEHGDHQHVHDENCDHAHEDEHVHDENCDHEHEAHQHVHDENCDHDHEHDHEEPENEATTKDQLKKQILLELIANKESIQVTKEDYERYIRRLASSYQMRPEDLGKNITPEMANSIAKEIRWNKALELVSANAITEAV